MPTVTFSKRSTGIKGLSEISVNGIRGRQFCFCGWGAPLIEAEADGKRSVFMAEACIKALYIDPTGPGLRYGPGARRPYRLVTEKLIEQMMSASQFQKNTRSGAVDSRDAEYRADLAAFALALIDLAVTA